MARFGWTTGGVGHRWLPSSPPTMDPRRSDIKRERSFDGSIAQLSLSSQVRTGLEEMEPLSPNEEKVSKWRWSCPLQRRVYELRCWASRTIDVHGHQALAGWVFRWLPRSPRRHEQWLAVARPIFDIILNAQFVLVIWYSFDDDSISSNNRWVNK